MKNLKKTRGWLVMAAALTLGLSACSSSEDSIIEQPANPTEKTYTMTVTASKGEDNALARAIAAAGGNGETRALALSSDGKSITATWKAGEAVTVYNETKYTDLGGTLNAQTDGATTTLTGTLTGNVAPGDVLTLKFLSSAYNTQDGTLTGTTASIDKKCDYATATVTVAKANDGKITTTGDADFQNQQAIIKFTLTDKSNSAKLSPTALTVSYGLSEVMLTGIPAATYSTNGAGIVYVALPTDGKTVQTVTLIATVSGDTYTYTKSDVTFVNGQYYEITVKMFDQSKIIDLSGVTASTLPKDNDGNAILTLVDGDVLTGALPATEYVKIQIAAGATVTLSGATIPGLTHGEDNADKTWAGITCLGNATIVLADGTTNYAKGYQCWYPGIQAGPENTTLTIRGSGTLTAESGLFKEDSFIAGLAAGIGGGSDQKVGNIKIEGGTIIAMSFSSGAGIGSGYSDEIIASCGDITITGGNITATGGGDMGGAGIGSGFLASCGNITIGGTAKGTATGGSAGIGAGNRGSCGTVSVTEGTIVGSGSGIWGDDWDDYDISCTFVITFKAKNGSDAFVVTDEINISGSATASMSLGEGSKISYGSEVTCNLPTMTGGTLNFTANCSNQLGGGNAGTFVGTLTNVYVANNNENRFEVVMQQQ